MQGAEAMHFTPVSPSNTPGFLLLLVLKVKSVPSVPVLLLFFSGYSPEAELARGARRSDKTGKP
jgi:hypothetical protein